MATKDDFVSVRMKRSVRTKAYQLARKLSKESGKRIKLHQAFDYKFNN
jgi:hypothetical protein